MILNRFFKPKWQHVDPQVRKQALLELGAADPILVQMARQDHNPEVRRAALERITELPLLLQIARQDVDAEVRQTAQNCYRALLAGAVPGSPPVAARLAALAALPGDTVDYLAVHGKEPELRLAALEQVEHESLLERIVLDDPAATVRSVALERIVTVAALERIARHSRARDKGIYRRAQERLDTIQAEQARATRVQQLCAELEQLQWDGELGSQAARFPRLEKEWQDVAQAADAALRERYQRARARLVSERQESAARRAVRMEICANLERFLGTLEHETELTTSLEQALPQTLQTVQDEWAQCGVPTDVEGRRLEQRFQELQQAIEEQVRLLHRNHERALRLRSVLQRAHGVVTQSSQVLEADLKTLQQQWTGLERPETRSLALQLQAEFDALLNKLRARLQRQVEQKDREWQELQDSLAALESALQEGELQRAIELNNLARQRLQENIGLSRKQVASVEERLHACMPQLNELRGWRRWGAQQAREHLCEQAESLGSAALEPPALAQQIKTLRNAWKALDGAEGAAPRTLWKRFDRACEHAYQPCQAYFEAQIRERERNLAKKQTLCERLERLVADTAWEQADWRMVDRVWREVQKEWHKIGPTHRAEQKSLERRFTAALQRIDDHLRTERESELQRRQALIEQVQQLANSADLQAAVEQTKQAQAEWHPTVQAGQREEQALWRRFRSACDAVFARRQAAQEAAEKERQDLLARKTALCEELEALAADESQDNLLRLRKRLQDIRAEWPAIGPLLKAATKALEQRFTAACERLRQHLESLRRAGARQHLQALRERADLCSRLEALLVVAEPEDLTAQLLQTQQIWDSLAALPDPLVALLQQRFDSVRQALAGGGEARRLLLATLQQNLANKQLLCLRLEVAAGVESPPEFAQARLEYQVARLSESLTGGRDSARTEDSLDEVRKIQQEWRLSGALPPDQNSLLEQRFERALAALTSISTSAPKQE